MVTLDPRNKQIICNKCDKIIGVFEGNDFTQSVEVDTFMRLRIYDVDYLGRPLSKHEFEVDFCDDCLKDWEKIIKKFKITRSTIQGSSDGVN